MSVRSIRNNNTTLIDNRIDIQEAQNRVLIALSDVDEVLREEEHQDGDEEDLDPSEQFRQQVEQLRRRRRQEELDHQQERFTATFSSSTSTSTGSSSTGSSSSGGGGGGFVSSSIANSLSISFAVAGLLAASVSAATLSTMTSASATSAGATSDEHDDGDTINDTARVPHVPTVGEALLPYMPVCCITHEHIQQPVVAADGHTYERDAILQWIKKSSSFFSPRRSPMTNLQLSNLDVVPNYAVIEMAERAAKAATTATKATVCVHDGNRDHEESNYEPEKDDGDETDDGVDGVDSEMEEEDDKRTFLDMRGTRSVRLFVVFWFTLCWGLVRDCNMCRESSICTDHLAGVLFVLIGLASGFFYPTNLGMM